MKRLTFALALACSWSFADYIFIECGKRAGEGYEKAEIAYSAEALRPTKRPEWILYRRGKEHKRATSLVPIIGGDQVTGYVITEKKPKKGPYLQFIFTGVEKCWEGGPAWLQIYKVGTGEEAQPQGSKKSCVCDID